MSTTPMLVSIPRSESLERARMTKNRISVPGSYTESAAGRRKSRRQDRTSTQSNENENRAARQANQIRNVAPTTSTPKEKQRRTSQSKICSRERNTLLLLFLIWSATVCRNLQCTHTQRDSGGAQTQMDISRPPNRTPFPLPPSLSTLPRDVQWWTEGVRVLMGRHTPSPCHLPGVGQAGRIGCRRRLNRGA